MYFSKSQTKNLVGYNLIKALKIDLTICDVIWIPIKSNNNDIKHPFNQSFLEYLYNEQKIKE